VFNLSSIAVLFLSWYNNNINLICLFRCSSCWASAWSEETWEEKFSPNFLVWNSNTGYIGFWFCLIFWYFVGRSLNRKNQLLKGLRLGKGKRVRIRTCSSVLLLLSLFSCKGFLYFCCLCCFDSIVSVFYWLSCFVVGMILEKQLRKLILIRRMLKGQWYFLFNWIVCLFD
jgi:hypothetical protein